MKRNGVPANLLAFAYTVSPLVGAKSITDLPRIASNDPFFQEIGLVCTHDAINRFINTNWHISHFHAEIISALQRRKATRLCEKGIYIIDHTVISKKYSNKTQMLRYVRSENSGEAVYVKGYELVSLLYSDESKQYPISFGLNTVFTDKITIAEKSINDAMGNGLPVDTLTFDTWFFSLIYKVDRRITCVTKAKKNKIFYVNGKKMHAEEIVREYEETVAELPKYGKVKVFRTQLDRKWVLLVSTDLNMSRERANEIYCRRMEIDNPFFRDMKNHLSLENFHTRGFVSIVNHTALRFLLHVLLMATSLRKNLINKTIEWIKNVIVSVAGTIKRRGDTLIVSAKSVITDTRPPPD